MVVFKVVVQLDDVVVFELVHDLDLPLDALQKAVLGDGHLLDQFNGVPFLGHFVPHWPNGSEGTFADHFLAQRFEIIRRSLSLLA